MGTNGFEHMRLKNHCLVTLSQMGAYAWNNPTGVFYAREGTPIKVGTPGAADILGVLHGQAIAIEVKTGTGRLSENQKKWRAVFEKHGGKFIELRTLEDLDVLRG